MNALLETKCSTKKCDFMKKLFVAICFLCGGAIGLSAQQTPTETDTDQASAREQTTEQSDMYQDQQDAEKDKISQADLPALVSQQLQSGDYTGWTVGEAYKKEKDGETFYKVELSNGNEKKWVKFDAQGNKIKEMDEKDKKHKDKEGY